MIQTSTFALSKDIARQPFGLDGRRVFHYLGDLKGQWESSHVPAKALELIGTESVPPGHLAAVRDWLGPLSGEESRFAEDANAVLADVAKIVSTTQANFDASPDIYETMLDMRLLSSHVKFPCRVLDIGAGAGRHMLNVALRPSCAGSSYCAIDSIGLPYLLQNLVATTLSLRDRTITFTEELDFEFTPHDVTIPERPAPSSLWHLPLWHSDKLPDRSFDLIICNYLLDEIPAEDFRRIVALIARCLAPDGIVYCRGGQQKSNLRNLQLFGYGTYHQQDITAAFVAAGLRAKQCRLLTAAMTRVFVRADSASHRSAHAGYTEMTSDAPLLEAMQLDFIRENVARIRDGKLRTLIWSDPGNVAAEHYLSAFAKDIPIVGLTNDHIMHRQPSLFGVDQYPLAEIQGLQPQALIIAGTRIKLAVRELTERLGIAPGTSFTSFNYPIAIAFL